MTREEAIEILQGAIKKPNTKDGYLGQAIDMAIKALEQEPTQSPIIDWNNCHTSEQLDSIATTKNDLALIHTEGLDEEIRCTMCTNSMKSDRGCDGSCVVNKDMYKAVMDAIEKRIQPITRNCFGCKYSKDNHNAGTEECHLCMWENQYTPTTKNDLGVDCISRKSVIDELKRYFHDEYYQRTSIQDCSDCFIEDVLNHLPSVTPQEPKTGHWTYRRNEKGNWENICSNCGLDSGVGYPYPYCPSCGAKMESEDKE